MIFNTHVTLKLCLHHFKEFQYYISIQIVQMKSFHPAHLLQKYLVCIEKFYYVRQKKRMENPL
jgi:hypothetical protein